MLAVSLVSDRDGYDCGPPVSHKTLCPGVEDGLAGDGFGAGAVDLKKPSVQESRARTTKGKTHR